MIVEQIVKAAIPNASDSVIGHILWGRTPYPCGKVSAKVLYKAASQWRRICDNNLNPCDLCHRIAPTGKYACDVCRAALNKYKEQ